MNLPRNATTRLIAAHLALVALATALVLGFIYWSAGGVVDREQRRVIETEIRGLADDYAEGGLLSLKRVIERRVAEPIDRDAVYLLTDAAGARIAGNLLAWPPTVAPGSGWVTLELYTLDAETPTVISALSLRLAGGVRLLVGKDVAARAAFDATLVRALSWSLVAMAALALVTGWLLSRLVLGRIRGVDATARAIMAGSLERRVPLSGGDDEFDRLARTLNSMLDRIASLIGELRMVTDSMAHNLRTPLGRLRRRLDTALASDNDPEARRREIAGAMAEADGMLDAATALLEISRIDAGLGAEQFEPIDLAALARDVADLYSAAAEARDLRIEVEAADAVEISGHPQLLAQALSNLLDNALRYAPAGSAITVGVKKRKAGAALVVADGGPGAPEADRDRMLKRFVRLDSRPGGDGLGLSLVDAVARLHGARLRLADNEPGLRVEIDFAQTHDASQTWEA